jgi:kumamolisin
VALDIQVAATVAPKADYVVYFAPNTDRGFIDAIITASHDTEHNPSVLSISWGAAESRWTPQTHQAFDEAFADAVLLGVTICCSTGDQGSTAGESDGLAHIELPAASPHALACGGTSLTVNGGAITDEVVWHDQFGSGTGGGISDVFDLPSWQSSAGVPPSANYHAGPGWDPCTGLGVPNGSKYARRAGGARHGDRSGTLTCSDPWPDMEGDR